MPVTSILFRFLKKKTAFFKSDKFKSQNSLSMKIFEFFRNMKKLIFCLAKLDLHKCKNSHKLSLLLIQNFNLTFSIKFRHCF